MRRFLPFFFIFVLSTGHLLSADEGKTVKITGIIKLYREKPEIKITSKDQIVSEQEICHGLYSPRSRPFSLP